MLKKEEISQVHPILELYPETVKCVFFGQVKKINTKKQVQMRHLLITNAAIFLLVKKKFPSGFRLSRFITYDDLSEISVMSTADHAALHGDEGSSGSKDLYVISIYANNSHDSYSGDSNSQHLALQYLMSNTKDIAEIIARMLIIKASFCPKSKDILDPSTPENIRDLINESNYLYESNAIFADRFLSLCVTNDTSPQLNNQIIELYKTLSEINNEVHFTSQMLSYIFIPQFTEAIANSSSPPFHDKPFEVIFEKGNYDKIARCLQILFIECSFVEKVTFNGVIFSSLDKPSDLFPDPHQTSLNTISFINSNLKSNDFKHLISDLNHYKGKITNLEIHDSDIDDHNFRFLFNTIFDAKCFKHLKILSLSGLEMDVQLYIMQFLGSNNVLKNKTIETLSVNNSTLSVENVLLNITLFETGLKNLILTRCQFANPIPPNAITTFQQLQTIDLSYTQFTSTALLSLFKELSTVASNEKSPAPSKLILNELDISEDDISTFYENLNGSIVVNTLTTFSWANNKITEKNIDSFFGFLKKQINLREIDVSFCLEFENGQIDQEGEFNDGTATPFKKIAEYIKNMKLEFLSIQGENKTAYKSEYFNIILTVFSDRLLQLSKEKYHFNKIGLDLRGQQIGNEGIETLTKIVNEIPTLDTLYFDHTGSSIDGLITLIIAMLDIKSTLQKTMWPEKDIKDSLHKVNASERTNYLNTTNELKKKFERRFGKSSIPKSASEKISDGLKAAAFMVDRSSSKSKFVLPPGTGMTTKGKRADKGKVTINLGPTGIPRGGGGSNKDFRKRGCTTAASNTTPKLINARGENTNSVLNVSGQGSQGNVQDYLETLVSMKEQSIDSLLTECVGPNEGGVQKDPLVIAMQNIQKSLEI